MLHRLAPEQAVIWADAADTAIVNSRESAAETLERVRTSNEVLISSECWSFPRCYNYTSPLVDDELAQAFAECSSRSPTCYANSGTYLGSSRSMERWFGALTDQWASFQDTTILPSECMNEQATLHHLYRNRSAAAQHGLRMRLDDEGSFFANMNPCEDCAAPQRLHRIELCCRDRFIPIEHMRYAKGADGHPELLYSVSPSAWSDYDERHSSARPGQRRLSRRSKRTGSPDRLQRPFIAHANARHELLLENDFFAEARAVWTGEPRLYDHPVLLLEPTVIVASPAPPAPSQLCRVTTLGELRNLSRLVRPPTPPAPKPRKSARQRSSPKQRATPKLVRAAHHAEGRSLENAKERPSPTELEGAPVGVGSTPCAADCSSNGGTCHLITGVCHCPLTRTGPACEQLTLPACSVGCDGHPGAHPGAVPGVACHALHPTQLFAEGWASELTKHDGWMGALTCECVAQIVHTRHLLPIFDPWRAKRRHRIVCAHLPNASRQSVGELVRAPGRAAWRTSEMVYQGKGTRL